MERIDFFESNNNIENMIYHLARYKFVMRQIDKTTDLLEVGCGTGYGSHFLSKYCNTVTGIDIDNNSIRKCQRFKGNNLSFLRLNILDDKEFQSISNQKFDNVVCFEVIEHMTKENAVSMLERIKTVKKDTGFAFISTVRKLPKNQKSLNRQIHHIHEYSIEELRKTLKSVFNSAIILSQLDESIGSLNYKNAWNYFAIVV